MALATKNGPKASEALRLPREIIIMYQIQSDKSFTKEDFRAFQNIVQVHQILCLPGKIASETISDLDLRLPTFQQRAESDTNSTQIKKRPCPAPVTQKNDLPDLKMPRKSHVCPKCT